MRLVLGAIAVVAFAFAVVVMITVTMPVRLVKRLRILPGMPVAGAEKQHAGGGGKRAESEEEPLFHAQCGSVESASSQPETAPRCQAPQQDFHHRQTPRASGVQMNLCICS